MKRLVVVAAAIALLGIAACSDDDSGNPIDTHVSPPVDASTIDTSVAPQPDARVYDAPGPASDASWDYGLLDIGTFTTDFMFDSTQIGTSTYIQAHVASIQMSAVFTGDYTTISDPVPPTGAAQTIGVAIHYAASGSTPATVVVMQQSQSSSAVMPPIVQLIFPNDALSATTYDIGVSDGEAMMLLVEPVGTSSCIAGVGMGGTVTVTAYTGITSPATDGGSIALNGESIHIYHPSATPMGDLSTQFGSTPACTFR
jgi:hypothetical protein